MSRKVHHSCLGLIKTKLKARKETIVLDKFIPTTKLCSKCGMIKKDLRLDDRTYTCECGYEEDRDVHAAKNMVHIWHLAKQFVPPE